MAAGIRSPLAPWLGGAGSAANAYGARSPFAFWLGGAASASSTRGVRSLLAFWLGGAALGVSSPREESGGGGLFIRPARSAHAGQEHLGPLRKSSERVTSPQGRHQTALGGAPIGVRNRSREKPVEPVALRALSERVSEEVSSLAPLASFGSHTSDTPGTVGTTLAAVGSSRTAGNAALIQTGRIDTGPSKRIAILLALLMAND